MRHRRDSDLDARAPWADLDATGELRDDADVFEDAMTDTASVHRFAVHRIDHRTWVIRDSQLPGSAARPVAHMTLTDDDQVEVSWGAPLPLPVSYATVQDAVDSLEDWVHGQQQGSTKPIPIPHFPPPAH